MHTININNQNLHISSIDCVNVYITQTCQPKKFNHKVTTKVKNSLSGTLTYMTMTEKLFRGTSDGTTFTSHIQ